MNIYYDIESPAWKEAGQAASEFGLKNHGILNARKVYWNLPTGALYEETIFRGPHKDALKQLVDRGTVQVSLPAKATKSDYQKFLRSYGLTFPDPNREPEAFEILNDLIKSAGLRKFTLHLRDGKAYANRRDETYTWSHFTAAFEAIISLSK